MAATRWFVSAVEKAWSDQRCAWSAVAEDPRPGLLRLFNKNANVTYFFPLVGQAQNHHGYIIEADEIPPYFSKVIQPWPLT